MSNFRDALTPGALDMIATVERTGQTRAIRRFPSCQDSFYSLTLVFFTFGVNFWVIGPGLVRGLGAAPPVDLFGNPPTTYSLSWSRCASRYP